MGSSIIDTMHVTVHAFCFHPPSVRLLCPLITHEQCVASELPPKALMHIHTISISARATLAESLRSCRVLDLKKRQSGCIGAETNTHLASWEAHSVAFMRPHQGGQFLKSGGFQLCLTASLFRHFMLSQMLIVPSSSQQSES